MNRPSLEKAEFWGFVISEHHKSGLSVREFCRQEGVSEPSFYQWRKKLASVCSTASPPKQATTANENRSLEDSVPAFLPITVLDSHEPERNATPNNSRPTSSIAEITTPGGYELRFSNATSYQLIAHSLQAIAAVAQEGADAKRFTSN